jgi:hypothetical protein
MPKPNQFPYLQDVEVQAARPCVDVTNHNAALAITHLTLGHSMLAIAAWQILVDVRVSSLGFATWPTVLVRRDRQGHGTKVDGHETVTISGLS